MTDELKAELRGINLRLEKFDLELATVIEQKKTAERVIDAQRTQINSLESENSALLTRNEQLSLKLEKLISNFLDEDDDL